MEKGQEFFAKIMSKDKDFLISKKIIVIGRDTNAFNKDDLKGLHNNIDLSVDLERINISEDRKMSKVAGLIVLNEKKRLFKYINLSKNVQLVGGRFLHKFDSVKLKNKVELCLANEMFFFVYSKALLMNYYKLKLERLMKTKEKSSHQNNIHKPYALHAPPQLNHSYLEGTNQTVPQITQSSGKKKKVRKVNEDKVVLSNVNPYPFETILKPPIGPSHFFSKDSENILDDIIESSTKVKIGNTNHKSILVSEKDKI